VSSSVNRRRRRIRTAANLKDRPRALFALRSLGVDLPPEIPQELADYLAALTPDDLERIWNDERELKRIRALTPIRKGRPDQGRTWGKLEKRGLLFS
jgi:hypothetical protein